MLEKVTLSLRDGEIVKINEYKLLPEWLEESEKYFIRSESEHIGMKSLKKHIYRNYSSVDKYISQYTNKIFSIEDIIKMMEEEKVVRRMLPETQGKILGNIVRKDKITRITTGKFNDLSNIKVLTDKGIKSIKEVSDSSARLENLGATSLNNSVNNSDIEWFIKENLIKSKKIMRDKKIEKFKDKIEANSKPVYVKPHIPKWRSAEQQCIEIEKYFGNIAEDVSKRNIGYDIESTTPSGEKRYIEVKSISEGGTFTLTNNEYTSAHQFGELYYICLIIQNENTIKAIFIKNPLENIKFEKRVKQWEWFCESYSGQEIIFKN